METDNTASAATNDVDDLLSLAIEAWKFSRVFQRALLKLEPQDQGRYVGQLRFFQKRVDAALEPRGIRLESLEGQLFEPGLAASALNADEFTGSNQRLLITQMIEPVVMGPTGVLRTGTFMLGAI
jgi:hypothetical protein